MRPFEAKIRNNTTKQSAYVKGSESGGYSANMKRRQVDYSGGDMKEWNIMSEKELKAKREYERR